MDLFSVFKWIKTTNVSMISTTVVLSVLIMGTETGMCVCVRKWEWLWGGHIFFFAMVTSRLPREKWCYLRWPFSLQVTGCRLAGGLRGVGGFVIRTDRNCRVWCSQYRCQKHQTVRYPYQVQKSSLKQRTVGGGWLKAFSRGPPVWVCADTQTILRFW